MREVEADSRDSRRREELQRWQRSCKYLSGVRLTQTLAAVDETGSHCDYVLNCMREEECRSQVERGQWVFEAIVIIQYGL